MSFLAWCLKKFGVVGTAIIGCLLVVVLYLAFAVAYQWVTGYFDGKNLVKVTEQRDTAIVERDVARTNTKHADISAIVTQAARVANDARVPAARAATAKAVERITHVIESAPAVPSDRLGPEQLQDAADAVARYRSAASRVRGTGPG